MDYELDLLERVVGALVQRKGEIRRIADESGIAYDTVLRIKNREGDPGYSKVRALAAHLGIATSADQPAAAVQG